jgi:glutamine synthetase
MPANIKKMLEEHKIEFVDLRFCDLRGKEHHVTIPQSKVDDNLFHHGKVFDGSSIVGWCMIDKSDLVLKPDTSTAILDPFCEVPIHVTRAQ